MCVVQVPGQSLDRVLLLISPNVSKDTIQQRRLASINQVYSFRGSYDTSISIQIRMDANNFKNEQFLFTSCMGINNRTCLLYCPSIHSRTDVECSLMRERSAQ